MKFDFTNKSGETLSGRIEMPVGTPRAYAIFAHCFTCTKNISAAATIARNLSGMGIAVLRFDFTGLGNSDGDFSNTNFSSNVEDLVCAFDALKKTYTAPSILIGHSLGGAAVLKASMILDEIKSVVTIGAPSCTGHVSHLFDQDIDKIERSGEATVDLAGRKFKIKKQFLEDLKESEVLTGLSKLKKAFLITHSPIDDTVSVDHAAKIFGALKHPKSFVSLDTADHLVTKKSDAAYIAELISSWLVRYLPEQNVEKVKRPNVSENEIVVIADMSKKFTQNVYSKDHHVIVDEPLSYKGDNLGLTPYGQLLAGLGACTTMTIKMYAERKGLKIDHIETRLSHNKIHANDCNDCETSEGRVDEITKFIKVEGDLTNEQLERIYEIAEKCPVNKTLQSEIKIRSQH